MIRSAILLSLTVTLLHFPMDARVVTYSTGKINTKTYEALSFWIKDNKRAYIRYAHGIDAESLNLAYTGLVQVNGATGFSVRFPAPDNNSFYIFQKGNGLRVEGRNGKYRKDYFWEDERKTDDPTSECNICAQDEQDAMNILSAYFFN